MSREVRIHDTALLEFVRLTSEKKTPRSKSLSGCLIRPKDSQWFRKAAPCCFNLEDFLCIFWNQHLVIHSIQFEEDPLSSLGLSSDSIIRCMVPEVILNIVYSHISWFRSLKKHLDYQYSQYAVNNLLFLWAWWIFFAILNINKGLSFKT